MMIWVDADACPVVRQVERAAKDRGIPVTLVCDTNHALRSDYSAILVVDAGADSADFALVNRVASGDLVVTQDYGVAAMALGKGARAIHQSGREFTEDNIGGLLMDRYLSAAARRASAKHHLRGPSKRTPADDAAFSNGLERLLEQMTSHTKQ